MIFDVIVSVRHEAMPEPYWHYAHSEVFVAGENEARNHEELFDRIARRIDEAGVAIADQAGTDRQWILQEEGRQDERDDR